MGSSGATPPRERGGNAASDGSETAHGSSSDALAIYKRNHAVRRSPSMLPKLAGTAVSLARAASPRLFTIIVAFSIANALVLAAQVALGKLAIEAVLDQADGQRSVTAALPALIGLVATTAVGSQMASTQSQLQRLLGERVQRHMWGRVLDVTVSVDLETFEDPDFFDDLERIKSNALIRPVTLSQGLAQLWAGVLALLVLAVTLIIVQPLLLFMLALAGVPLFVISRKTAALEFRFAVDATPPARLRSYLTDTLSGRSEAKEVRAFGLGPVLRRRWAESYEIYLERYAHLVRRRLVLATAGAVATLVATSGALTVLLWSVYHGRIALSSAGAALIAIRLAAGRTQQIFTGIGAMFESSLFLRDFESFTRNHRAEVTEPVDPGAFAEMRIENVRFRYPGSDDDVLKGVSLSIRAGETIALVGENGSGKTTLAKILARMYMPTSGRVLWDEIDLAALEPEGVRQRIGVIFQDFLRYQLSARENIAFGRVSAASDDERVRASARQAGAAEFLEALPAGYETGLGKEYLGGFDLSGGQWQRMALARAFFRDADLLVLDEPTSALDARAESEVFEHVRRLASNKSLMLISHRFATVKNADRIFVLHQGELVEEGSHDELIAVGGRYAELFELQARSYR